MGFFGLGQQRRQRRLLADRLYAKAVAGARQPMFYSHLQVPDSVDGRFDLLVLHVFLLLHRLQGDGPGSQLLAQSLFDLMFADMDRSLREMGVSDMSVGKRIKDMARAFYGRIDAYDAVLDDKVGLRQALSRNLYRGALVSEVSLAALAAYVQTQVATLAARDLATLTDADATCFAPLEAP
jgi:cytochrome b pre-mRNA-processing protein 3